MTQDEITANKLNAIRRSNYILYGVILVMFAVIVAGIEREDSRIKSQATTSCKIQKRGLPAGHELAKSMNDIHKLLLLPRTAPDPRAPKPPFNEAFNAKWIIKDLNMHLAVYQTLESKQPKTRKC